MLRRAQLFYFSCFQVSRLLTLQSKITQFLEFAALNASSRIDEYILSTNVTNPQKKLERRRLENTVHSYNLDDVIKRKILRVDRLTDNPLRHLNVYILEIHFTVCFSKSERPMIRKKILINSSPFSSNKRSIRLTSFKRIIVPMLSTLRTK